MRLPAKPFADQGGVVVLAHRGFSARYPENTMLAFDEAAKLPSDGLEMDIHATCDDHLVVSHDDSVARMTDGEGKIQSYTLAELKKLDAGYRFSPDGGRSYPFRGKGLTVPTLDEVLSTFTALWINVDIKQHEPRVVRLFCDLIQRHSASERLCVGSFADDTLARFRKTCPDVVTRASRAEIRKLFVLNRLHLSQMFHEGGRALQIPPTQTRLGVTFDVITPRMLAAARAHDMAVHLWTINEVGDMKRYLDIGVDGLITDYPDRALRLLGRMPQGLDGETLRR
jgi:glycerophosphoryl diester phosphodiesterase